MQNIMQNIMLGSLLEPLMLVFTFLLEVTELVLRTPKALETGEGEEWANSAKRPPRYRALRPRSPGQVGTHTSSDLKGTRHIRGTNISTTRVCCTVHTADRAAAVIFFLLILNQNATRGDLRLFSPASRRVTSSDVARAFAGRGRVGGASTGALYPVKLRASGAAGKELWLGSAVLAWMSDIAVPNRSAPCGYQVYV